MIEILKNENNFQSLIVAIIILTIVIWGGILLVNIPKDTKEENIIYKCNKYFSNEDNRLSCIKELVINESEATK